ncbi:hypothetical protein [Dactylosporangium matsuzakiense]|uniref:Uncharacterized protein n=1 Tax=Dactylosporangium matsuzakiense TaxID=53360 RepID=A0A9W6NQ88_9ACTN|nr:hypothetical protein [Dactylosporangium matsuzakiense]UWZ40954.1 hypothetical protein Dmats_24820 [Dactylosporangium matsuzakiense]GLL04842.1 hypothetical protein GCM10017581_065890 [Dactylosporangium matsuzakiense]
MRSALRGHIDPVLPTGLRSELTHRGLGSRLRQGRTDVVHQPIDALIQAAPWVLGGLAVYGLARAARRQSVTRRS